MKRFKYCSFIPSLHYSQLYIAEFPNHLYVWHVHVFYIPVLHAELQFGNMQSSG